MSDVVGFGYRKTYLDLSISGWWDGEIFSYDTSVILRNSASVLLCRYINYDFSKVEYAR